MIPLALLLAALDCQPPHEIETACLELMPADDCVTLEGGGVRCLPGAEQARTCSICTLRRQLRHVEGDRKVVATQRDATYAQLEDLARRHGELGAAYERAQEDGRARATWTLGLGAVGTAAAVVGVLLLVDGRLQAGAVTGAGGLLVLGVGGLVARW